MKEPKVLVMAVALVGMYSLVSAQVFNEDFESYPAGTALHGQGGWKGWDNDPTAGAPVSGRYAYNGRNSVEVIGSADLVHEFRLVGGRYEFSVMQYIPTGSTGESYFILLNQYADKGPKDWSVQLKFNLTAGIVTAEAEGDGATTNLVYDQWTELKFFIDLGKNTCEWHYAGSRIATHEWDDDRHGTLQAIDLYGNGASPVYYDDIRIIQNFRYKASPVAPADGAVGVVFPLLQWTKGDTGYFHNVYLGRTSELTEADLVRSMTTEVLYYHLGGIEPGVPYYWRIDEVEADGATVHVGDVWSFTAATGAAFSPRPRDGDRWIATTINLVWSPGRDAAEHVLYFGVEEAAVAGRAPNVLKGRLVSPDFAPGELAENTQYFWVVDEIDLSGVTHAGEVWTFTTIGDSGGVKAEYFVGMTPGDTPAITRTEANIDFNWGNSGPGAPVPNDQFSARWTADLEIAVADSYTFIIRSDDGSRLWLNNQLIVNKWFDHGAMDAASTPIYLEPGVYTLCMEYYENSGAASAQLYWRTATMDRRIVPPGPLQPPAQERP
ncbi:MAG TPA: PA14 domain-containing protein [Sedimentisphaerales bacterium]|nr:PA14 domain-containing protein [Sedimentisphaerales bacterium]